MPWRRIAVALALVLSTGFLAWRLTATSADNASGAMAVDCNALLPGVQAACAYPVDTTFAVQVHVAKAPRAGYGAFQAKLRWNDAELDYQPGDPANERLWSRCTIPARTFEEPGGPPNTPVGTAYVLFGCAPFPTLTSGETASGAVVQYYFRCTREAFAPMTLVARDGDAQLGTHFLDLPGYQLDPLLSNATVTCGNPPTPTPCAPEGCPTATPSPTNTPWPTPPPTATPEPLPELSLEGGCVPHAFRPGVTALIECTATIINVGETVASEVTFSAVNYPHVEGTDFWLPLLPFDAEVNGQAVQARDSALPDIAPGEAAEVQSRYIVTADRGEGTYGFWLTARSGYRWVADVAVRFAVSNDAAHPPKNLALAGTRLTELPIVPAVPPQTLEYEFLIVNTSDSAYSSITVLDRYTNLRFDSAEPPPAVDTARQIVTWEKGPLESGEELRLRATFVAQTCAIPAHELVVVATTADDRIEIYALIPGDYVYLGCVDTLEPHIDQDQNMDVDQDASITGGDVGQDAEPERGLNASEVDEPEDAESDFDQPAESNSDTPAADDADTAGPSAENEPVAPEDGSQPQASVAGTDTDPQPADDASAVAGEVDAGASQPGGLPNAGGGRRDGGSVPWPVAAIAAAGVALVAFGALRARGGLR
jgi:hypothetical protein